MRPIRILGASLLALLFSIAGTGAALAQTGQSNQSFTLQPGGRATITFEAFCTDFGKKFPLSIQMPNAVAEDNVRGALGYIQSNNLAADPTTALEAQYAIWQVRGATDSPAGGDQAKTVANAASNPPVNPQGTSIVDAAKSGQVQVTVSSWQPVGDKVQLGPATDNFYGRGTLTVENTSQQALNLYMPVGALFPPTTAGEQTMAGYATNVQASNPQPTPQPTTQPSAQQNQQQTPRQLPETAASANGSPLLLLTGALALLVGGTALHMRLKRR